MSTVVMILGVLVVAVGMLVLGSMVRDAMTRMSGSGVVLLLGFFLLFLGERVFGVGDYRLPVSIAGLAVLLVGIAIRVFGRSATEGDRRSAHTQALVWTLVSVGSLALYAITLPTFTESMEEAARDRWVAVWSCLFPIGVVLGLGPIFLLDRLLAIHTRAMPQGATRAATSTGLTAALAVALLFPVNYLASSYDNEVDLAYFQTTKPGEATISLTRTMPEPVEAILFYPAGNDVEQEAAKYFKALAEQSNGMLTYRSTDQALVPALAEELKIRDNGEIVLKRGDSSEKFQLKTELKRAKRDLKKLDATVQTHLMKLTRPQRQVYFYTGHGEANTREREDTSRKLGLFKRGVLETMNLKVKDFGIADGSMTEVPDDATAVVIAAPTSPLLPEEVEALKAYWNRGGSLFVLGEPGGDPMTDLLSELGVELNGAPIGHLERYADSRNGKRDRHLLVTNKYGSHKLTRELSRVAARAPMVLPIATSVSKLEGAKGVTTLLRTFPESWHDANRDYEPDPGPKSTFDLAVAISKKIDDETEARAVVVGDVGWMSDFVLDPARRLPANQVLAAEISRWLVGEDDVVGGVNNEEDVRIEHTRNEDIAWFYLTIFAIPALVLGFGIISIQLRRRKA